MEFERLVNENIVEYIERVLLRVIPGVDILILEDFTRGELEKALAYLVARVEKALRIGV